MEIKYIVMILIFFAIIGVLAFIMSKTLQFPWYLAIFISIVIIGAGTFASIHVYGAYEQQTKNINKESFDEDSADSVSDNTRVGGHEKYRKIFKHGKRRK